MPGGDGTGPPVGGSTDGGGEWRGAGTGWLGRGAGAACDWGVGRRRGWRHRCRATDRPGWARGEFAAPTPDEELDTLRARVRQLESALDAINGRLEQLTAGQQKGDN